MPEGLVLLMSLTFAVAAVRLSGRGMLVQSFNAVESLANVDTVCLDKTGTLTDGTLALHGVTPMGATEPAAAERLVADYAASATSRNDTVDAIAAALPGTARPVQSEVPFSSRWKWSACRLEGDERDAGAGRARCAHGRRLAGGRGRARARGQAHPRSSAVRPPSLTPPADGAPAPVIEPVAVIALEEHVRPEAGRDDRVPARPGRVGEGHVRRLARDRRRPSPSGRGSRSRGRRSTARACPSPAPSWPGRQSTSTVFARLAPQQKRMLVEALTASGRYVAMIGDGVNDVPAMKGSRLAIALGSGAQMAKSVADSVLVTDNFAAVPAAIAEGRQIIQNVQRVARLFVTKTVFAACVILAFGLTTAGFPLLPRHLTLAATVTVGIPGFVIALIPSSERPEAGSFLRSVARFSIPAGSVIAVGRARRLPAGAGGAGAVDHRRAHGRRDGVRRARPVPAARARRGAHVGEPAYAVGIASLVGALAAAYLGTLSAGPARDFFALAKPDLLDAVIIVVTTRRRHPADGVGGLSPYPQPAAGEAGPTAAVRLTRRDDACAPRRSTSSTPSGPLDTTRPPSSSVWRRNCCLVLAPPAVGIPAASDHPHRQPAARRRA